MVVICLVARWTAQEGARLKCSGIASHRSRCLVFVNVVIVIVACIVCGCGWVGVSVCGCLVVDGRLATDGDDLVFVIVCMHYVGVGVWVCGWVGGWVGGCVSHRWS